ncbi:hypothetical protein EON78_02790, partial [bacterium]
YKSNIVTITKDGYETKAVADFRIRQVAQVDPFQVKDQTVQAANIYLSEDGKTAYVAYDIAGPGFGGGVQIIDVSDPYKPVMKAEMSLNDTDIYDLIQKDNNLYLAGASETTDKPAFMEVFGLRDNQSFDKSVKQVLVPSYAATGVNLHKDKILVTSGDKGGVLSEINQSDYSISKSHNVEDARDVSVSGDKVAVIGATPGKVYTFENSAQKNSFDIPGATIPVSQSTIQLEGNIAYVAAGNGGFQVIDTDNGQVKYNYKPSKGITNGVSYNNGRAFLANGEDGISVLEKGADDNFEVLGKLNLEGSSNVVLNKGCLLFAATGLGGLTISVIEDSRTGQSCYNPGPSPSPSVEPTTNPSTSPSVEPTASPVPTTSPTVEPSSSPMPTPPPTSCSNEQGFIGWYIYDNKTAYETVSNPNFTVDFHGDPDLFYYEPSGARGLMDPAMDKKEAFAKLERYVLDNVDRMKTQDTFSYDTTTTLDTFKEATYTYALSYLYVPEGDKSKYTIEIDGVDDAATVLVNGRIVGNMILGEGRKVFDLGATEDGTQNLKECRNSVMIILADDSKTQKYIRGVKFLKDGQQINQLDPSKLDIQ